MAIQSNRRLARKAARIAGFTYLFTNVTAIFAQFYVPGHLLVQGNPAQTAANIMAHERLFRFGILCELITFAGIILLAAAFYVVLKPVSPGPALRGAFWRLAENIILAVMTFSSFQVLTLHTAMITRLASFLPGWEPRPSLICSSKSRFIPRKLAAWGTFRRRWSLRTLWRWSSSLLCPTPWSPGFTCLFLLSRSEQDFGY